MKKKIKILCVSVVLVFLGYYGYTSYKQSAAMLNVVHKDADTVIKIGLHDLKETIILDAITSPNYYYNKLSNSEKKEEEDQEKADNGIELQPYNLLFFAMPTIKNTWFAVFNIYNSADFEVFIKKELDSKSITPSVLKDEYTYALLKQSQIAIAWKEEQLIVAFSPDLSLPSVHSIFKDVLLSQTTITDTKHPLLAKVDGSNSHIHYTDGESKVDVSLEDGQAVLSGMLVPSIPAVSFSTSLVENRPNTSISLHYNGNFQLAEQKLRTVEYLTNFSFFKKNNLDVFKISNRTNGLFGFNIAGTTIQTDTVITYVFDDNFEKIAQRTVRENKVPKLYMSLDKGTNSLRNYLLEVDAITSNQIFKAIPLYKLYVKEDDKQTYFSTDTTSIKTAKKVSSNIFDCTVNFNRLEQDLTIPKAKDLFALLNEFSAQVWIHEDNKLPIQGFLSGKNKEINIASQLFFGMQEK